MSVYHTEPQLLYQ